MKLADCPDPIKPYIFHGMDLQSNGKEFQGDCPLCGKENKWSVNVETGKWRCFVCGENGNQYTFIRSLYNASLDHPDRPSLLRVLSKDRGIAEETLATWGVVPSIITGEALVPGYSTDGQVSQLYRYVKIQDRKRLLATPTLKHGIHGINLYDKKKSLVYLCEGPWDGMKLWETLSSFKEKGNLIIPTKNRKQSFIATASVLAVPGCSTFSDSWEEVFRGKKVYIVYDNDHPRTHPKTNKLLEPASLEGVRRVSGILGNDSSSSLHYLRWGTDGYDSKLPNGTDVRDILADPRKGLKSLLTKIHTVPKDWVGNGSANGSSKKESPTSEITSCSRWLVLSNQWRKAMKWSDGLDVSLSAMLACCLSTELPGDQLWIKIIGPASCGKSTLCEAVSSNKKYVLAKSTIRGFHSGFKADGGGDEDNSLISQVHGKTLVTKDGDTLLQSPNLGQILSEARDVYDRVSRTHYRNKMGKDYTNINMTWLLCGTSSLRSIDSSELGERFLDCVIMDGIDDEMEDEVLMRVALREDRNISNFNRDESSQDADMSLAVRMTGGYVDYLRKNDRDIMSSITTPHNFIKLLTRVGKFVAFMRARPSSTQQETADREFGARLVSQHTRLAKCLAAVLNRNQVDEEVMRRVVKIALDTARGITLDMCLAIYEEGSMEVKGISLSSNQTEANTRTLLRFLKAIGVVKLITVREGNVRSKKQWALTDTLQTLFTEILDWRKE